MSRFELKSLIEHPLTNRLPQTDSHVDYYTCIGDLPIYYKDKYIKGFWACTKGKYDIPDQIIHRNTIVENDIKVCKYIPEWLQKSILQSRNTNYNVYSEKELKQL
jgi:hypothetical protein